MKIQSATAKNFMKYSEVTCSFDPNVTYLVGKNGQGKSGLGLAIVQAALQGIAEKASNGTTPIYGERFRFIGSKGATAMTGVDLIDEKRGNAVISVRRKITKSGSELSIVAPDDYPDTLDQAWLNNLFNLFMIAPKQFQLLPPKEQANAIGIDTAPFDKSIAALKVEHTAINREIAAFGPLEPLEEVKEVDVVELQGKKEEIRKAMAVIYRENQAINKATREAWQAEKDRITAEVNQFNEEIDIISKGRATAFAFLGRLQNLLAESDALAEMIDYSKLRIFLDNLEPLAEKKNALELFPAEPTNLTDQSNDYTAAEGELVYIKEMPDDADLLAIDQQILDAGETNKNALLYTQYLQKKAEKESKEKELKENKEKQQAKADERLTYIKSLKLPFSNLTVDDDGQLLMNGRPLKEPHFSTGEMLKILPILISTSKPELKYVFIQDFNLMDEDKQQEVEAYLTGKGFQLVIEFVGTEKMAGKNCILLRDNVIVESYEQAEEPQLSI